MVTLVCIGISFLLIFAVAAEGDEFSRVNIVRNWVRALLALGVVIVMCLQMISCNRQNEFNDKAKICGLGCYDKEDRITAVLDSLCNHNWVRFGELLTGYKKLRGRYLDDSKPNDYVVGCRDTNSGDVLKIELTIYRTTTFDGEGWVTDFRNDITKITLKNANGIADSTYRIDPAYFRGGSGFENGYCAVVNDTCAMIFKMP